MKKIKKASLFLIIVIALSLVFLTAAKGGFSTSVDNSYKGKPAKYVFLFIGDGVGMPQIQAAEAYMGGKDGSVEIEKLLFSQFPGQGLTTTHANNRYITGSAAAATAIACGKKTNINVISMDPAATSPYPTLTEMAKAKGMATGVVSSVNLDHATPASFYAHTSTRKNYYDINIQAANSNVDYFAGGMFRIDKTPEGEKSAHDVMLERGWQMASNRSEFNSLQPGKQTYAYNVGFAGNALDYVIDMDSDDITLAEFTQKGIDLLQDNKKGFFMMVEAGKVDWACHANDGVAAIHNTLAFDDAVKVAFEFYKKHPKDTLIVVTGDHECGGLTLGFAGTVYSTSFSDLSKQKISYEAFDKHILKKFKAEKP
ncbi:MAG: alkaline phosphatase, partial [Spirochaetes bacterium]|nr:alkaline phosphatase [Spirochaetota bacterium]